MWRELWLLTGKYFAPSRTQKAMSASAVITAGTPCQGAPITGLVVWSRQPSRRQPRVPSGARLERAANAAAAWRAVTPRSPQTRQEKIPIDALNRLAAKCRTACHLDSRTCPPIAYWLSWPLWCKVPSAGVEMQRIALARATVRTIPHLFCIRSKAMIRLSGSVGKGGVNLPQDVKTVQGLLNKHIARLVPLRPLVPDGRMGPVTIAAIERFQREVLHLNFPDSRVDPGGRRSRARAAVIRARPGRGRVPGSSPLGHRGARRNRAAGDPRREEQLSNTPIHCNLSNPALEGRDGLVCVLRELVLVPGGRASRTERAGNRLVEVRAGSRRAAARSDLRRPPYTRQKHDRRHLIRESRGVLDRRLPQRTYVARRQSRSCWREDGRSQRENEPRILDRPGLSMAAVSACRALLACSLLCPRLRPPLAPSKLQTPRWLRSRAER